MSDSTPLSSMHIAIVGLGLMGGSLAMAMRGKCAGIAGLDRDPKVCAEAMERGIVDRAGMDPAQILPGTSLVILALPVSTIQDFLAQLPSYHPGKAVVIDLGSTKAQIISTMDGLPERFDPIGGHPMCGKEKSTLANADPAIYREAPIAFTALSRTSPAARSLAEELAASIGSHPIWIEAREHDRWVASTSHLPYLISIALAASLPLEVAPLIGPGYRSASRLAGSSSEMMIDILKTNRENILAALEEFRSQITQVEDLLKRTEYPLLQEFMSTSQKHQDALLVASEEVKYPEMLRKGATTCN